MWPIFQVLSNVIYLETNALKNMADSSFREVRVIGWTFIIDTNHTIAIL